MLNSILMLGSTYNKSKKLNVIFAVAWIIFMLASSNLKTGLIFTIINFIVFGLVCILGKIFKGKYSNKIMSVFSVLIWSIVIDVICYFLYPEFTIKKNIFMYIGDGILFNCKYVIYNIFIVSGLYCVKYLLDLKVKVKIKELAVNN